MLDSQHWKGAQAAATMPFHLDGDAIPASRTSSRRSWISTADGIVERVENSVLSIGGDVRLTLRHSVPETFELSGLLGCRVRVTLLHVASLDSGLTQTLTIAGFDVEAGRTADRSAPDAKLLLIGHSGEARGAAHRLGSLHVYVALSQRSGGPMVFGTSRVQSLLRQGDHVRVRDGENCYVMHFESRRGTSATYAIGAEELWRGPPSTKR